MGEKSTLKFMIIGKSQTGKSSLIKALQGEIVEKVEKDSSSKYNYFSNASNLDTTVLDKNVTIKVLDTGGRSANWRRYRSYKDVHGVIITYNASSQRSLQQALNQASIINAYLPQGNFPLMLVGTKCDITDEKDLNHTEAEKIVKENKMEHRIVSAVTKEGINELLPAMIELVESMSDKIAEVHADIAKRIEEADIQMKKDRDKDSFKTVILKTKV